MLKRFFSFRRAYVTQRRAQAALLAVLFGAILAFGVCSFAPSAHAATVAPRIATSVNVKIVTSKALSVRVVSRSVNHCYNTPAHTATITGLAGQVSFTGYASANCAGGVLCTRSWSLPPSGTLIINIC